MKHGRTAVILLLLALVLGGAGCVRPPADVPEPTADMR